LLKSKQSQSINLKVNHLALKVNKGILFVRD